MLIIRDHERQPRQLRQQRQRLCIGQSTNDYLKRMSTFLPRGVLCKLRAYDPQVMCIRAYDPQVICIRAYDPQVMCIRAYYPYNVL